jgi:hypothetical protein
MPSYAEARRVLFPNLNSGVVAPASFILNIHPAASRAATSAAEPARSPCPAKARTSIAAERPVLAAVLSLAASRSLFCSAVSRHGACATRGDRVGTVSTEPCSTRVPASHTVRGARGEAASRAHATALLDGAAVARRQSLTAFS